MKNPQILQVCILLMHSIHHGFTQIVTCQQHGEAVLSFHFSFISGPEDLHVTMMKMQSIGDTNATVIYAIDNGAELYYAAQFRNRAEISNDLPRGKLELILKHVEESDAGIYKCQAANKKKPDEKMIQLHVEIKEKKIISISTSTSPSTSSPAGRPIGTGVISVIICVVLTVSITLPLIICWKRVWVPYFTRNRNKDILKSPLKGPYETVNIINLPETPLLHKEPQYQKEPTRNAEAGMLGP